MSASPLQPRNRIVSQTTGLYKLQLPAERLPDVSPTKPRVPGKLSPAKSRPFLNVQAETESPEDRKNRRSQELLKRYAEKQALLLQLEKQVETVKFELLEIQTALPQVETPQTPQFELFNRAGVEVNNLKKKMSTIFQEPQDLRRSASNVFTAAPQLKSKASAMFNTTLSGVREKIDTQLAEFTKRGSGFAKSFLTSFLPRKENFKDPAVVAESSFMVENLERDDLLDKSVILDESDTTHIDIDDYESD